MKILNNQVEIEASDIAALSAQLQTDVAFRAGDAIPAEYLSARFNAILEECTVLGEQNLKNQNSDVALALGRSDKATQEQVKAILGIAVSPSLEPAVTEPEPVVDESLWTKLTSVFK